MMRRRGSRLPGDLYPPRAASYVNPTCDASSRRIIHTLPPDELTAPYRSNGISFRPIAFHRDACLTRAVLDLATMNWGHALGWPPAFLTSDPDPLVARLQFLAEHGLRSTGVNLADFEALDGARRDRLTQHLEAHGLAFTAHPPLAFFEREVPALLRDVDHWLRVIDREQKRLHLELLTICAGPVHRFLEEPSLEMQLERLQAVLTPFARGCHDLGLRVGIENHGDYYVSDLVELCHRTPHLGIFLDTGNCFLVGEKPLQAAIEAAPYLVGSHFKDQRVRPVTTNGLLHFEVKNAMPGTGHVPLQEIHEALRENAPPEAPLWMQIECFPENWKHPLPEFERALAFLRSLDL